MKISIITVTYNSRDTIKDTIESVRSQTYDDIEYIIIDGGSTDGTIEIVNEYEKDVDIFISEPDDGIYDAMNKGIALASGDVIGILNSDDFYADNSVLNSVAEAFLTKKIDCIYGDLVYIDSFNINKITRYWKSDSFTPGIFYTGWHPAHPTFFVKKSTYEKFGLYKTKFKLAADYELMLRFLEKNQLSSIYIPKVLVKMRCGGISNKSFINIIKANIECYLSWEENDFNISPIIIFKKIFYKIKQFYIKNL